MERIFFDKKGREGCRYIVGWGKQGIVINEEEGIGYFNPNITFFHLKSKDRQIESMREAVKDIFKYNILKKMELPSTDTRESIEIFLLERADNEDLPSLVCVIISGELLRIEYDVYDKKETAFENIKDDFMRGFDEKKGIEFENIINTILQDERKRQIEVRDIFKKENNKAENYPSEVEVDNIECSVFVLCPFCKKEGSVFFDCNPYPKTAQILDCSQCGARYEVAISNVEVASEVTLKKAPQK